MLSQLKKNLSCSWIIAQVPYENVSEQREKCKKGGIDHLIEADRQRQVIDFETIRHVSYALSEPDNIVLADAVCYFFVGCYLFIDIRMVA